MEMANYYSTQVKLQMRVLMAPFEVQARGQDGSQEYSDHNDTSPEAEDETVDVHTGEVSLRGRPAEFRGLQPTRRNYPARPARN